MSASIFDRLGHGPKNGSQDSLLKREQPQSPPKNKKRAKEAETRSKFEFQPHLPHQSQYQQPQYYGSDQQAQHLPQYSLEINTEIDDPKSVRLFEIDDDDDNLSFSAGIRNASILHEFCVPKIVSYIGKGDFLDHVNTYKTEMSLQGASPALKCRTFHFTLAGRAKRLYNKLGSGSISS
ncbi:Retrotrans gag domain-containing protein [Abeliophyllum distichum]|uniref:Retrotrans gag domain-containing protein n=1 Tax=Abeliophyllum distichum TaxID=126358 RepID=A0ABD1V4G3_9LAMI